MSPAKVNNCGSSTLHLGQDVPYKTLLPTYCNFPCREHIETSVLLILWTRLVTTLMFLFLNRDVVAYNLALVFAVINLWISHMSAHVPFFLEPPSPPTPCRPLLSFQVESACYTAASHQLSIVYNGRCNMSTPPSIHPNSPIPLYPQVSSLCLHPYSCPCKRFICTIFLGSIYVLLCNICFSPSSTSTYMT